MGLLRPDWMSRNMDKAISGLESIQTGGVYGREEFRKAALNAPLPEIRLAAAKAYDSNSLFVEMMRKDPDPRVRLTLVVSDIPHSLYMDDCRSLLEIEKDPLVCRALTERIARFERKQAEKDRLRKEAEEAEKAEKAERERYQEQLRLEQAQKDAQETEKLRAMSEKDLVEMMCNPDNAEEWRTYKRLALPLLREQGSIYEVALRTGNIGTYHEDILSLPALELLTDDAYLTRLFVETTNSKVRDRLAEIIENQAFLAERVIEFADDGELSQRPGLTNSLQYRLVRRITDRELLGKIIKSGCPCACLADIRLQELESQELCPGGIHDWIDTAEEKSYDSEGCTDLIYQYQTCSRCGKIREELYYPSGRFMKSGDSWFKPRV